MPIEHKCYGHAVTFVTKIAYGSVLKEVTESGSQLHAQHIGMSGKHVLLATAYPYAAIGVHCFTVEFSGAGKMQHQIG